MAALAVLTALLAAMFVVLAPAKAQQPYVALNLVVDFPEDSDDTIAAGTSTKVRLRLVATDLSANLKPVTDAADREIGKWASLTYTYHYSASGGTGGATVAAQNLTYLRASDGLILTAGTETGIVLSDGTQVLETIATPTQTATVEDSTAHVVEIGDPNLKVIVPAGVDDGSAVISAAVVAGVTVTYQPYVADDGDTTDNDDDPDLGTAVNIYIPLNPDGDGNGTADDPALADIDFTDATTTAASVGRATRLGSATLNIGNVDEVNSINFGRSSPKRGSTDPGTTEPAFVSTAGGTTQFTLHVFNANDKPSQINSISSIVVSTTSGTFSSDHSSDDDLNDEGQCGGASTTCELEPSRSATSALPKTGLKFLLAAPTRSGVADIRVVVISRAGNVLIDDSQQVTFHGPAAALEIGDASGTVLGYDVVGGDKKAGQDGDTNAGKKNAEGEALDPAGDADKDADARDQISFSVSAADKAGTTVGTPTLSAKITGPDGKAVSNDKFEISQSGDLSDTLHLDIDVGKAKGLAVGAHQIKVSAGALSASGSFTVVGTADSVVIEAGEADEDGQIEVTVTVTDAEGNNVADGTTVTVREADLRGDQDQVLYLTSSSGKTKGGVATATFITIGPGRAAIIATADGKTDVERVTSTYDAPEPVEEAPEVVSLDCLSSTVGFATYTCGVDSTASELFALLHGRGASAIHLWNGTAWVRYAMHDGTMIPGSMDFTVQTNDILYVSN